MTMRFALLVLGCVCIASSARAQNRATKRPTKAVTPQATTDRSAVPPPRSAVDTAVSISPTPAEGQVPSSGGGDWAFALTVGMHSDDGTMRGTDRRSVSVVTERFDFANASRLFAAATVLKVRSEHTRIGGTLRYYGAYNLKRADNQNRSKLGQLYELVGRAEYVLPLRKSLAFIGGLEGGLVLLTPGGAFEQELEALKGQGAGVWNVPRAGYTVGPAFGLRHALGGPIFVRGDFGASWEQMFLFFTHDDVSGVVFEKTRRSNVIRYHLGVSVELRL